MEPFRFRRSDLKLYALIWTVKSESQRKIPIKMWEHPSSSIISILLRLKICIIQIIWYSQHQNFTTVYKRRMPMYPKTYKLQCLHIFQIHVLILKLNFRTDIKIHIYKKFWLNFFFYPFKSQVLLFSDDFRMQTQLGWYFKLFRSLVLDSKESIPPAYVACRAGTTNLFLPGS